MSAAVMEDDDKKKITLELGPKITAHVTPLLDQWRSQKGDAARGSTLIIEPMVQKLRVVGGAARFWAGAFVGESFIDLDLKLTDSETREVIATPHVQQNAGAWSIGQQIGTCLIMLLI